MSGHLRTPWKILRDPDLDPLAKIVLQVVISHVGEDGFQLRRKTIAREAKVSTCTVRKVLPVLEERGLLMVERRFENGERKPDFFRPGSAWLAACADEGGGHSDEGGGRSDRTPSSARANRGVLPQRTREVVTTEVVTSEVVPPPQVPPEPDAEQSAAAAPVVAESSTCAPSSREEEEESPSGREEERGGPSGWPGVTPYWATQRGFVDVEEAGRFLDTVWPDVAIEKRSGFLRNVRRLEEWAEQVEEWRRGAAVEELIAVKARFAHHGPDLYRGLSDIWRPALDPFRRRDEFDSVTAFDIAVVTAIGEALDAGVTWQMIEDELAALPPAEPKDRPEPLSWLAKLTKQMAQPVTVAGPLPLDPWDLDYGDRQAHAPTGTEDWW